MTDPPLEDDVDESDSLDTRTVVYQYAVGTKAFVDGQVVKQDFDDEAMRQLRLAHNYYNELVSIWKHHEELKAAVWREHPEVALAGEKLDELVEQAEIAADTWRKSKIKTQDRKGDPEAKAAMSDIRAKVKKARTIYKQQKDAAYASLLPRFSELNQQKKDSLKAARQQAAEGGLLWGQYNRVGDNFRQAVAAVESKRKAGMAADLGFRRWQGEGEIGVQLQRAAGDPQRDPASLASGESKWKNQISLPLMQERKHRTPVTIRTGWDTEGKPAHLTLPEVIIHRPIPEEGDVTNVVVSRRRVGRKYKLALEATVKLPKPAPSSAPGVCGIDTGWRVLADGSIRAAVWRGKNNGRIVVPHHLQERTDKKGQHVEAAIVIDGEGGEIRIPHYYVVKWERVSEIRGQRDRGLELLRDELIKRWPQIRKPEQLADIKVGDLKRWRSPSRFVWLCHRFKEHGLPFADAFDEWRLKDTRLWDEETRLRNHVLDWRKDMFRVTAALLTEQNHLIGVEKPFVAKVVRKPEEGSIAEDAMRRPSVLAAPATFILALKSAASARGVEVSEQPAKGSTVVHRACGHENPPDAGVKDILIKCEGCGETYDQDVNAAEIVLDRAMGLRA